MWVRFLADWAGPSHPFQPAGTELEVDAATAHELLAGGVAEPVPAPLESATVAPSIVAARVDRAKPRKRGRR